MPLSSGDKLGPYEILSPLGAGGMGEVYKARDTRLDRSVAVKVLPEHIAKREDLRGRFEREARAVASLNHPNICTLFDIGSQDGISYMVMELMEGETLGARIERGPIPLEQALVYAAQIADALDRAHRAGVTHRDVKPANIMLTRDGVKVLDFGLAKSVAAPGPNDATIVASLTTEGSIIGTPQYMAPEQFEGKEADARADIWAFGAVLYEMVTGQKAFQGKSYGSLVGSILSAEPAPMAVAPFTPAWLERLVRRCLAKDPERRYQSMRDIVLDLDSPPQDTPASAAKPNRWPWIAAACALLAIASFIFPLRKTSESPLPAKFDVNPPLEGRFAQTSTSGGSAISPDGRTLAYVATDAKEVTLLYLRPLDSLQARALPGTENAGRPFWSPDSKSLAFVASNKLKRIDVAGGVPITLCDADVARGGTWNEDGVILFADRNAGLLRIAASGAGASAPVTKINPAAGEVNHYYPNFLPGGKEFLYLVVHTDAAKQGIYWGSLDGKPPVQILQSGYNGIYDATSGRLLYIQGDGVLTARKLELNPPRLSGDPVIVAQGIGGVGTNGYAEFSISSNGTLFYGKGTVSAKRRFEWWDRTGKRIESVGQAVEGPFTDYSLSPDGSRVAFTAGRSPFDIWVMSFASGIATRLTFTGGTFPQWSPDGRHVYYANAGSIYKRAADGSGAEELLAKGDVVTSVSPDEKHLLNGRSDIFMLPLEGEKKPVPYLQTKFNEGWAVFSPDGRWVAYDSDESGRTEVYIQGFPERRGKWQISAEGGGAPHWRADGKELYWMGNDRRSVMAAPMELQVGGVKAGRPELLFRAPSNGVLSRDGKRFLVQAPESGEQPSLPMVVVEHWAAGLGK